MVGGRGRDGLGGRDLTGWEAGEEEATFKLGKVEVPIEDQAEVLEPEGFFLGGGADALSFGEEGAPDVADGDGDGCEPRLREVKLVGGPYDVGVMAEWTCKLSCCTRRCLWVMAFVSTDLVDMRALACRYPSP